MCRASSATCRGNDRDLVRGAARRQRPAAALCAHLDDARCGRRCRRPAACRPATSRRPPRSPRRRRRWRGCRRHRARRRRCSRACRSGRPALLRGTTGSPSWPSISAARVSTVSSTSAADRGEVGQQLLVGRRAVKAFRIFLGDEAGGELAGAEARMLQQRREEIDIVADPVDLERVERLDLPRRSPPRGSAPR